MCGVVGLNLRDPSLHPHLGELVTGMLCSVAERGPDAAGVAVYGDPHWSPDGAVGLTVLAAGQAPAEQIARDVSAALGAPVTSIAAGQTIVLHTVGDDVENLVAAVRSALPQAVVIGFGQDVTVLKGVGHPQQLAHDFGLSAAQGWQAVAHTRMATESAVTSAHSHPFAVGPDQCLVHNGSFSNHATIRRELIAGGARFDSDNDSEVGARFVAAQLAAGDDLEKSLHRLCDTFDGFYTLLVANSDSFAVVRDAIACKPAIIAETERWVAVASEYRALAALPGVAGARIYEPEPEEVYAWQR